MMWFIIIVIVLILIAIGISKNNEKLKKEYDEALKGTDKTKALKAGRNYFSALRNGNLTIYDEQAINNDILTMETGNKLIFKNEITDSTIEKLEKLASPPPSFVSPQTISRESVDKKLLLMN